MGYPRKYKAGAYIPKIKEILAAADKPMTRKQIADTIGTTATSIATAMLDLTRAGDVVKLMHTNDCAATYRLPDIIREDEPVAPRNVRQWYSPQAFPWNVSAPVSLPLEPWADKVPHEATDGTRKSGGIGA